MPHYIGLDLGGTNVKAGLVDGSGEVIAKLSQPTPSDGPEGVIDSLVTAAQRVAEMAGIKVQQVAGIGVGAPGVMDIDNGIIIGAPNLPGFKNVPLSRHISERIGRPTVVENDANAAALGEYWVGSGRDRSIRNLVMLTLGTGIGGGIIIDGHVFHGGHDIGAEIGHMIIQPNGVLCGCGQRGCLEMYASASATARRAAQAIDSGEESRLKGKTITAKDVFDAAKTGDTLATRIVDETALYLGIAVVNLCRILDPQMIVFAGGMILAGDMLFEKIRAATNQHDWKITERRVQIVPAQLGNDAGFIGAAAVAWDAHQCGRIG